MGASLPPVSAGLLYDKGLTLPAIEAFDSRIRGDGTTDDSDALKAAHDAAHAAGVREVYCGKTYYAPNLWNVGNVIFCGPGRLVEAYRKRVIPFGAAPAVLPPLDIDPAKHLVVAARALSSVMGCAGDSTTTENVWKNQGSNLWALFRAALWRQNPGRGRVAYNRAIGGSGMGNFGSTGTALQTAGMTLPSWFGTPAAVWSDYVRNLSLDLLLFNWGTNDAAGMAASVCASVVNAANSWPKVPSVLFMTPAVPSTQVYSGSAMQTQLDYRDFAAGFIRSWCEYYGYGYIDLHRLVCISRDGFDPRNTALTRDALSGSTVTFGTALPRTTDWRMQLQIDNTGGASFGGSQQLNIPLSAGSGNSVRISRSGTKYQVVTYEGGGGSNISATSLADIPNGLCTIDITVKDNWCQVQCDGADVTSGLVVRGGGDYQPMPAWLSTTGAATYTLAEYWTSDPILCAPILTDLEMYGLAGGTYPWGGNGNNHQSELFTRQVLRPVFDRSNLSLAAAGIRAVQSITAATAINRDCNVQITGPASSTYAITLAAPRPQDFGRDLVIEMTATTSANTVTLALTNVDGGTAVTTATFSAASQKLFVRAGTTKWTVMKEVGVVLT